MKTTKFNYLILLFSLTILFLNNCKKDDVNVSGTTVTDINGNLYHTVVIGTQTWMVENLKTTKYRNGDTIPKVTDNTQWHDLATGAYCTYNNDPSLGNEYGNLYNWYTVNDSRKIAPIGWHVASDSEWKTLTDFLKGDTIAGGKMKETGITHWSAPNSGATNEVGFSALGGGYRDLNGSFQNLGILGVFWTSTEVTFGGAWDRLIYFNNATISGDISNSGYEGSGGSVRCVKD